MLRDGDE